jgi:hypothetical protein
LGQKEGCLSAGPTACVIVWRRLHYLFRISIAARIVGSQIALMQYLSILFGEFIGKGFA